MKKPSEKIYSISTGKQRWKAKGSTPGEAVISAFKRKPPKSAGLLTSAKAKGEPMFFLSTEKYLSLAGFNVK